MKIFKSYPVDATDSDVEMLGVTLAASLALSVVCFALLVAEHTNFAFVMWLYGSWAAFIAWFILTFVSERIVWLAALVGSEAAVFFSPDHTWWWFLAAPIALVFWCLLSIFVGFACAFVLMLLYRGFIDGQNKESYLEYPMTRAKRLGRAIVNFGTADRFMPLWGISMLARYVCIGYLICAFSARSHEYFTTLRWLVVCSCIYTALLSIRKHKEWILLWIVIAYLFNPMAPLHLSRGVWTLIDWCVAVFLVISIFECPVAFGDAFRKLRALDRAQNLAVKRGEPRPQTQHANGLTVSLQMERRNIERQLAKSQIESRQDELTSLLNRRALEEVLSKEVNRAQRYKRDLAVVMAEIDHFKLIEDRFPRTVSDNVLSTVANILHAQCRSIDSIARYGGEEFLLCFPEIARRNVSAICEKIRQQVELYGWAKIQTELTVTMSLGVATAPPDYAKDALLDVAFSKLREARNLGGNRVLAS